MSMKNKAEPPAIDLRERLELPKAILIQLRETCLFNEILEEAIKSIDEIMDISEK